MSTLYLICFLCTCVSLPAAFSQAPDSSIAGVYKSPKQDFNHVTSESLLLNTDATFIYHQQNKFFQLKANGTWKISGKYIILTSRENVDKMMVEESDQPTNTPGKIKFHVAYKDGTPMNYQLYLLTPKDTTIIRDAFMDTTITRPHNKWKSFYIIDSRGMKYPTWSIKKSSTQYINVRLEIDRIFDHEQWKFIDGKINPVGLNGTYARYALIKE